MECRVSSCLSMQFESTVDETADIWDFNRGRAGRLTLGVSRMALSPTNARWAPCGLQTQNEYETADK